MCLVGSTLGASDLLQAQMCNLPFQWKVQDEKLAASLCYTSGTSGKPKVII